jgi:hypothetical protein
MSDRQVKKTDTERHNTGLERLIKVSARQPFPRFVKGVTKTGNNRAVCYFCALFQAKPAD